MISVLGCKKCYPKNRVITWNKKVNKNMEQLFEETQKKLGALREKGYNVIEMWECDFNRTVRKQSQCKAYEQNLRYHLEELRYKPPLCPRAAYRGGRVNAFKLYHKCQPGERIDLWDINSLYPTMLKYKKFPIGHPVIIKQPSLVNFPKYEGLVFGKVLPPRNLYLPMLPYNYDGKLAFPLCRTCLSGQNNNDCLHTDEERCLVDTWLTPELQKAVELGYQLLEIYEVWHFEETAQFDKRQNRDGLFNKFVDTFYKLKTEGSGYPRSNMTEEEKNQFIEEFEEHEGIRLDPQNMERNEGKRSIGKLLLNSKYGESPQITHEENKQIHFFSFGREIWSAQRFWQYGVHDETR